MAFGALFAPACSDVRFVDRIEVVNETDYPANVDVRGRSGGWVDLTTVGAGEVREVEEVIDQGGSWTFRFSYGGRAAVESTFSRSALAGADWRVEVPADLEQSLRNEGVPVPP